MLALFSQLGVDVGDELAQVFVDVPAARVEPLGDVFQCFKEAVEVHLGVLAAPHHVLVNNVVVSLANVRVGHVVEFGEALELI